MSNILTEAPTPKIDRGTGFPETNGQTRMVNGSLQYMNPMTGTWQPAVRLQDLRASILQRANPSQYRHGKLHNNRHQKNPTDFTSFHAASRTYGKARTTWSPTLFQIQDADAHMQEPTTFVEDSNRVVLDPFDHGIRDFPEIPELLSSVLEGHDIEDYLRRNLALKLYDLIARMPNGFYTGKLGDKWHRGPPRLGTVSMRATRFRLKAGLINWGPAKAGSETIAAYILKLIPQACIDDNSTLAFRNLTKEEQEGATAKNKGTQPNRKRKAKRMTNTLVEEGQQGDEAEDTEGDEDQRSEYKSGEQHDKVARYPSQNQTRCIDIQHVHSTFVHEKGTGQNTENAIVVDDESTVRQTKRRRHTTPSDRADQSQISSLTQVTKPRQMQKKPSSPAPYARPRESILKQQFAFHDSFADDVADIAQAGGVHMNTVSPWKSLGYFNMGQYQRKYFHPSDFSYSNSLTSDPDVNPNAVIFGGSHQMSQTFDGSSSPSFTGHVGSFPNPPLDLNPGYGNILTTPYGAEDCDVQGPAGFFVPLQATRQKDMNPSMLHGLQGQTHNLNRPSQSIAQKHYLADAQQTFISHPSSIDPPNFKRKRTSEVARDTTILASPPEFQSAKRLKHSQHTQDTAKERSMTFQSGSHQPFAAVASEYLPKNFTPLARESLGAESISSLNTQSHTHQVGEGSEYTWNNDESLGSFPDPVSGEHTHRTLLPQDQPFEEVYMKPYEKEDFPGLPSYQLQIWDDFDGWDPTNDEDQAFLDLLQGEEGGNKAEV